MKTTKRSKMLLSSIAMLLVALVALGSATFAWYSINKTVTATGVEVHAATAGGLRIYTAETGATPGSTWTNSINFNVADTELDPAAITVSAAGAVTAQSGVHNDGEAVVGTPTLEAVTNGTSTYYIAKSFKVKNTDKTAITATPAIAWTTAGNSFFSAALY